jgi:hypothetical protein
MRSRFRPGPAMIVACIAVLIALGGTATAVTYVVSSNSQVGPGTISGHKPPSSDHANIISGSVNATDLSNQAVTAAKIAKPEAWHAVGAGSTSQDLCTNSGNTAVFCSDGPGFGGSSFFPWDNLGNSYATAGFYKDQLGIVHLKGIVAEDTETVSSMPTLSNIFRLPPSYAPTKQRVFPGVGGEASRGFDVVQGRVDVQPNGLVTFVEDCTSDRSDCSASGSYVTLDAISYRPDG